MCVYMLTSLLADIHSLIAPMPKVMWSGNELIEDVCGRPAHSCGNCIVHILRISTYTLMVQLVSAYQRSAMVDPYSLPAMFTTPYSQ